MHGANAPLMKVRDRNIYKNNWKGWCVCLFVCCVFVCECVYLCTSVSIFAPSSPSVPPQIMVTEEVEREKRVLAGEEQRRVISLQVNSSRLCLEEPLE